MAHITTEANIAIMEGILHLVLNNLVSRSQHKVAFQMLTAASGWTPLLPSVTILSDETESVHFKLIVFQTYSQLS